MWDEARLEYLEKTRQRYRRAGRMHKKMILDEFCSTWEHNHKYAIDLLNGKTEEGLGRCRRSAQYGARVHEIWVAGTRPCSRRLKSMVLEWPPLYEEEHGRA